MTKEQILERMRRIESDLSPENLTHDGELDSVSIRHRLNKLRKEQNDMIRMLGRKPTMQELYPNCGIY